MLFGLELRFEIGLVLDFEMPFGLDLRFWPLRFL